MDTKKEELSTFKKLFSRRNIYGSSATILEALIFLIVIGLFVKALTIEKSYEDRGEVTSQRVKLKPNRNQEITRPCNKRTKFIFIQTHRTASQTQSNILYRAALRYNLVVLPFDGYCFTKQGLNHRGCPLSFLSDIYYSRFTLPDVYIGKKNFDEGSLLQRVMPNDTVAITSLRIPRKQIISHLKSLSSNTSTPGSSTRGVGSQDWHYWAQLCNGSEDYRKLSEKCLVKKEDSGECLSQICKHFLQRRFSLVTITDDFNDSVVMLKRKMCWSLEDVIYSPLNGNKDKTKISDELLLKNSKQIKLDEDIYSAFNTTLWKEIKKQSPHFIKERRHFQKIQYVVTQFCDIIYSSLKTNLSTVYEVIVSDKEVPIPKVKFDPGFKLTPMLCVLLKLKPEIFNNIFIVRLFPEVCKFVKPNYEVGLFDFKVEYTSEYEPIVHMHPYYCSPLQTKYRIPLEVLEHPDAYYLSFKD